MSLLSNQLLHEFLAVRQQISEDKNWGLTLPEEDFIRGMVLLNPQAYGARIEKYIARCLKASKVAAAENCGDIRLPSGKTVEIKASILTPTNAALNMVQIRLFHHVDYYLCVAYDLRDLRQYRKYVFLLTHDDMCAELKRGFATAAHGTKTSNRKNANIELRYSFDCIHTDETFQRWQHQYASNILSVS